MTAAVVYAFGLGMVAALNPCGFALLPAYLAVFARSGPAGTRTAGWIDTGHRVARGLRAGAGLTVGFVAVFAVAGVLVHAGVSLLLGSLGWPMVLFGLALTVLGALVAAGRSPHVRMPVIRMGVVRRTLLSMVLFGVAYAMGSLACALPLFLAGVAGALTRSGIVGGAACYLAYALGMGLFVTAAAVVTALVAGRVPATLRRGQRFVPRLSGVVLALSGLYLTAYWWAELATDSGTRTARAGAGLWLDAALRRAEQLQAALVVDVDDHVFVTGAVLTAVVAVAMVAVAHRLWAGPAAASQGRSERHE